ncbi:thioester reductase domain-containing protein [Nocardia sp. NBC_01503]|uniref:thioester reductase domain-containing protein n=1 Tax=Nocardia sp. NBC_01503 TaxID=2975997 RepID=UPI002E7BFCB1|nr:thioester reductase domain-containing protein [Nocardia sp. NBC_01503]WTL30858.1 thioester reductase domain-containing protein [Nocardia sp. NBC_01503]
MTGPDERLPVRNAAVDRRHRAETLERGTATMDIADLLARTGTPARADGAAQPDSVATTPDTALADAHPAPPDRTPRTSAQAPRGWTPESLAEAITELANRFTTTSIDADTDFFDAGGTSLAAVELVAALARELDIHPDLDTIFFDARPRRLARRWLADHPELAGPSDEVRTADDARQLSDSEAVTPTHTGDRGGISAGPGELGSSPGGSVAPLPGAHLGWADDGDLARHGAARETLVSQPSPAESFTDTDDLALLFADLGGADRLPIVAGPERVAPQRILLTGTTGFLGSHMLLDLLRHSQAHVVCLVRADDDQAAAQRLEDAVRRFALPWSREVLRRVTPLAGDLRLPRLGLSDERWNELAVEVDSIVNAGAAVDFLRGYPSLRRTNVLGPLTLAELACTGRPKPVHHISSMAVFNGSEAETLGEDEPTANVAKLPIGYDRSKWAAEAILRRASEHGLVVTVMRPGGIGSHPETGAHNPRDLNAGITAALMRFRTVPGFRYLNSAPVDWVSRTAAAIVCTPSAWGHTYHLTGAPTSLEQIVAETSLGGLGIRVQHWEQWCADVVRAIREGPVPELESLAQVLQSPVARTQLAAMVTAPPATAARTDAFVAAHGLPTATIPGPAQRGKMLATMAGMGPQPGAEPYLRFHETLSGTIGPAGETAAIPCDLRLALSVASSAQVFSARTLDINGELTCPALHDEPLTVQGTAIVRPHDGIPLRNETRHPIMHYQLTLRDSSGGTWWLEGYKFAAARRRMVRQLGTQLIEIGRTGEPAAFTGEVAVPMHTYLPDQIDGIEIDPRLPERQQRLAKMLWLSWFGGQLGKSLLEPMLRVGTDLLDLRRAMRKEQRR